jgi:hypothetical protein
VVTLWWRENIVGDITLGQPLSAKKLLKVVASVPLANVVPRCWQ